MAGSVGAVATYASHARGGTRSARVGKDGGAPSASITDRPGFRGPGRTRARRALDQAGAGSADAARVRLVGSMPLLPVGVIPSAAVPPDERVEIQVHLLLRDQAGADALALAVSTPGNPLPAAT